MRRILVLFFLFYGGFGASALASDLFPPFFLETPDVLPAGVRNPRFINLMGNLETKFNALGDAEPIGNILNQRVSWRDVLSLLDDSVSRSLAESFLSENVTDFDGSPGSTTGRVTAWTNVMVPALAIGVTDRFTLGVAIPIVRIDVSADTGFQKTEEGQAVADNLCKASVKECQSLVQRLNNAVNEKLTFFGYEPIRSKTTTSVGDVQLLGKYLLYDNPVDSLAVRSTLVLPTGTGPNVDAALDIPTGGGRWQLGGTVVYGRRLSADFRWMAYGGGMALMPNTMERRIPSRDSDPISSDKEILTRNLGAKFNLGTSLTYTIPKMGLVTGVGYQAQYLTQTTYSGGSQFSEERYRFLENLSPSSTLHTGTLMAGFSSVEWYQANKFFYPFQANLVYSQPLFGQNAFSSSLLAGELVLFF